MDKNTVKEYYIKWIGDTIDESEGENFISMLNQKATHASNHDKSLYAFDGLKTPQELDTMLSLAIELQSEGGFAQI